LLLAQRVEAKLQSSRVESVIGRIRVAEPAPRPDGAKRQTFVPASVMASRSAAKQGKPAPVAGGSSTDLPDLDPIAPKRMLQRDLQEEYGGAGVYSFPLQRQWSLGRPEWADDMIPEIMDGKNIADFVDPDIEAKLDELEREEEERAALAALEDEATPMDHDGAEAHAKVAKLASAIRKKKGTIKATARRDRSANHPTLPRNVKARGKSVGGMVSHLSGIGIETDASALSNLRKKATARVPAPEGEERGRSPRRRGDDAMDVEGKRSASRERSGARVLSDRSSTRRDSASVARSRSPSQTGLRDAAALAKMEKLTKQKQFRMNKFGKATESDRRIAIKKPKHLFAGKRGNGKTDRR
jgi:nucleolar GTP-binding protein